MSRSFPFMVVAALVVASIPACSGSGGKVECGPPVASVEEDIEAQVGETVVLRGSVRLPPEDKPVCVDEKDALTFKWELFTGPVDEVGINNPDQQEASFVPQESGEYVFHFQVTYPVTTVNAEEKVSQPQSLKVNVASVICGPPTADAGDIQTLATLPGSPVTVELDGTGSHVTSDAGCGDLTLAASTWSVVSQPAGSDVSIQNADQLQASVEITELGVYELQLEVQDSGGADGRTDTDTDSIMVNLIEREGCGPELEVTVIEAAGGSPIAGAEVTVVDADGASHSATADANGLATFDSLAEGNRQSITAASPETVPALPGTGDTERPRYEITTVLDHCSGTITVPMYPTASARASMERGTVTAKMPASVFDMLPHSWRCAGECTTDDDCDDTYYCEQTDPKCAGLCTPKSLLPFFSLGDANISGQMRVAVLIPVTPVDNFSRFEVSRMFANPPAADAVLPGNLTTDDTFLNGIAPTLGLPVWGDTCTSREDCPTPEDPQPENYVCEEDPNGEFRCKDKNPLRNLKMEVPAGQDVRLVLVSGVMDVIMVDLLPVLMPFLTGDGELDFDVGAMLGAFKIRALHVCPVGVDVAAGAETDITSTLAALTPDDCWNIDYQQLEATAPLLDPGAIDPSNTCTTDDDCCAGGECGWPASGKKCMGLPDNPDEKYCFMPLFRVQIESNDRTTLNPGAGGFEPAAPKSDGRLCNFVPAEADYEVMCDNEGLIGPCDPREIHTMTVPEDAECSYPYGLAMVSLDFPPGHAAMPAGGRVGIGFDFNRTPFSTNLEPSFLVPALEQGSLQGASLTVTQMFVRKIEALDDMSYMIMPGTTGVATTMGSNTSTIALPPMLPLPAPDSLADAGFEVHVTFEAEDPTVWPDPVIERVYTTITGMVPPSAGTHDLPASVSFTASPDAGMVGLVLSEIHRVQDSNDALRDPQWRIYARAGTTDIELPADVGPFASGDEVWLRFWSSGFEVPFDFDLFPTELLLTGQKQNAEDSYAVVVP